VTVYGPTDSDALPPTTFSYQVKPFEFEAQTDWTGLSSQGQSAYYWNSIHGSYKGDAFVTLADIDGDGLVDRVMRKAASPYTNFVAERNTGSNFLANDYRWYPLESQGQTSYTWNSIYVDDSENVAMIKFLDINGDSYPDRVMRNLSSPYTNFVVEFNSGVPGSGAFSADEIWGPIDAEGTGYWLSMHKQDSSNVPVDMADINGDGLPDRIMRKANSPYNLFKVQLNNGHGFNALVNWWPVRFFLEQHRRLHHGRRSKIQLCHFAGYQWR
jgi:hypothetical protein